ncbi:MAG: alpha/beta hydrolase family protein [Candidatus Hinthialibacter sp.]
MKNHFTSRIFGVYVFLALWLPAGCATIARDPYYQGPFERPPQHQEFFTTQTAWEAAAKKNDEYEEIFLTPRDHSDQPPIIMDFYRAPGSEKQPALLISPILGGKNRVASHFARYFSRRGYHCLIVHRPKDLTRDLTELKQLDMRLQQAVARDRAALDWLCLQTCVDRDALGSFGVSYGAIKNTALAGVDERLKANIFALAGADLATIITHSNHKILKRLKDYLHENGCATNEQIEERIRNVIKTEPLRFAPFIDPKTTLLILARCDKTTPRANGELLRKALGTPRTVYILSGHYSAAFYTSMVGLPYIETLAREFFDKHLKNQSDKKITRSGRR